MGSIYEITLLRIVMERQGERSDRAYAKVLRLSHTTYVEVRKGIRSIGITFLEAVAQTYPDLDPLICALLRERAAAVRFELTFTDF